MGLLFAVVVAESSAMRARYAYSEKTGQWLRCYAAKKRLVVDRAKPNPETFADILALEITKKRYGSAGLSLFLDPEPDGKHYLCLAFPTKRQKFFSLKFSQPKFTSVVLPVDLHQIGQLHARFGEFKKTFGISMTSAAVGDTIRKQAK